MTAFEVGGTYWTPLTMDSYCYCEITVLRRTPKTLTTTRGSRLRIIVHEGVERVKPFGSYPMAPVIGAEKKL